MLSPKMKPFVFSFFIFRLFPPVPLLGRIVTVFAVALMVKVQPHESSSEDWVFMGPQQPAEHFLQDFGAENGAVCWLIFVYHAMQLILSNTGTFTSQLCLHIR